MAKLRVDKIAAPIVKDEFTGSVHFDGTGDYLDIVENNNDFDFDGDFTVEFWVYFNTVNQRNDTVGSGNNSVYLGSSKSGWIASYYTLSGSKWHFSYQSNQSWIFEYTFPFTSVANTWYHVAFTREGSSIKCFVDGVQQGSTQSSSATLTSSENLLRVGGGGGSTSLLLNGYLSNLRICKGHAVYTGNFTPPTRELEVHTAPPKGVVFPAADNRTVLLACQSSTDATADSSGRHTITAAGNATAADANPGLFRRTNISTTITENTGAVYFDGSGDYLKIGEGGTDFSFGTDDFTVETWIYPTSLNAVNAIVGNAQVSYTNNEWLLYLNNSNKIKLDTGLSSVLTSSTSISVNVWTHIVYTRQSGTHKLYINGVLDVSSSTAYDYSEDNGLGIGGYVNAGENPFTGYISNLRICKGHAVYKSQFIPPTRELEVHQGPDDDRTVLLACYDGENIFADKSGRHIIAAYGDRLSSPTPTATDSPIGSTTVTPGLTRNVDPTAGPTFQGGAGFTSQNWLTLPKGTTTDRNRTGGRAIQGSGYNFTPSQTQINSIFYYQISSTGNALDFGDLLSAEGQIGSLGSSTRGIFAGQSNPAAGNVIQFVTIATTGNAVNFGDMTDTKWASGGAANSTRGLFAGGRQPSYRKTIDYITIATLGDAADFGDLTATGHEMSAASSPTRAIFAGGSAPGGSISNLIDYVTIATTGNALDFGDLTSTRKVSAGVASQTRMCVGGGLNPGLDQGIEYLTISTLGNAKDFGNLTGSEGRWGLGGTSNSIRGVFGGGYDPSPVSALNTMDYITIASTGNANDFGDIGTSSGVAFATGLSDSHGGIS